MAIKDFDPSTEPRSHVIGREVLATAAAVLLYPLGLIHKAKRTARHAEQRTVVLVHGYLANTSALLPLKLYLRARGLKCISYGYGLDVGVEAAALGLKRFLREHVRGGRIDLVGHSLGGLVARVFIQDLGGARRVDHCITLGTPHRGTYNAYWVPSRVGNALRPDSTLMTRLNAPRAPTHRVRHLSVVAGSDNIIIPRVFAHDAADLVHVPNIGHLGMLFSPTVFKAVGDRLLEKRVSAP
jgi:triacylglycerol lipase